jgi:hypothetical protein
VFLNYFLKDLLAKWWHLKASLPGSALCSQNLPEVYVMPHVFNNYYYNKKYTSGTKPPLCLRCIEVEILFSNS